MKKQHKTIWQSLRITSPTRYAGIVCPQCLGADSQDHCAFNAQHNDFSASALSAIEDLNEERPM